MYWVEKDATPKNVLSVVILWDIFFCSRFVCHIFGNNRFLGCVF